MKHRWLIPVLFLILAALACDDGYVYDPIRVQQVTADSSTPGHAYALVGNTDTSAVYETDDYGEHWRRSEYVFPDEVRNSYTLRFSDATLFLDSATLWRYPRSTFRSFFVDDVGVEPAFSLASYSPSNSASGDALYVAMGTEGVLVGPAPSSSLEREWVLTANGIDLLDPIPLTLTNPLAVLGVIALALLVPPLPLLHSYILSRVWAYILPRQLAWRYALATAGGLSLLAAVGVGLWLTNIELEYGWIVGGMTVITAVSGVGLTWYFARERAVPAGLRNRLLMAALFASLIVPTGVIGVFVLWWLIFLIVFGYRAYSDLYFRGIVGDKRKAKNKRQQWLIDRLTAETLLTVVGIALLVGIGVGGLDILFSPFALGVQGINQLDWLFLIAGIIVGVLLLAYRARQRFIELASTQADFEPDDDFDIGRFRSDITAATIKWAVFGLGAAAVTFVAQIAAWGWFQNLLLR